MFDRMCVSDGVESVDLDGWVSVLEEAGSGDGKWEMAKVGGRRGGLRDCLERVEIVVGKVLFQCTLTHEL